MKEENMKNDKQKEIEYFKNIKEDETNNSETDYWWIIIFFIFAMYGFNNKDKNYYYKPSRTEIINFINNSDLSNEDKRQIIDILLK